MDNLIVNGSEITLPPFNLTIDINYPGVLTTFTYPPGVEFLEVVNITQGEMNLDGDEWTIDDYVKNSTASITIKVVVTDVELFSAELPEDRTIVGDTTDLTGEIQLLDNVAEKAITGITCVDVNSCQAELPEYETRADAVSDLGPGKLFVYSETNLDGAGGGAVFRTPL